MTVRSRVAVAGSAVTVCALFAAGCSASASDDKHPDHKSFSLPGKTLTVDSDNSKLELVPADVDDVRVTRWFSGSSTLGKRPAPSWKISGDKLTLRMRCSGIVVNCSARHRIEVPRDVSVKVENDNGKVEASGFRTALTVDTDNGSVHVSDVHGTLALHSSNGGLSVKHASSRRVEASSSNGSIDLDLAVVPDSVVSRSSNGSTTITVPRSPYHVTTESHTGGVHVDVERDDHSAHRVSATSHNGGITVRNPN
ncbi:DUF4097 family beta strand repeat-containing protein [Streptomyces sp. NPDC050560]|uniref:DUF4097 family beta strand repeat-containing protein n=1 Tax=Streptomyces sp. NPDC050560 TaxID=3365630 RepID=UPI00378F21D1